METPELSYSCTPSDTGSKSLRLEKMLGDHLAPTSTESKGSSDQVAQGFIRLGLGKFARREIPPWLSRLKHCPFPQVY